MSSDMTTAQVQKYVSAGAVALSSRMNLVSLLDGSGYSYVFPSDVTDPDSRYFPVWTESTDQTTSFTTATDATTTWSEL